MSGFLRWSALANEGGDDAAAAAENTMPATANASVCIIGCDVCRLQAHPIHTGVSLVQGRLSLRSDADHRS